MTVTDGETAAITTVFQLTDTQEMLICLPQPKFLLEGSWYVHEVKQAFFLHQSAGLNPHQHHPRALILSVT